MPLTLFVAATLAATPAAAQTPAPVVPPPDRPTCNDPYLRSTTACKPFRVGKTLSDVGWPVLIVSWAGTAAVAGAGFREGNSLGAVGVVPVVGPIVSVAAGDWTLGQRLLIATGGAWQIVGFVLGVVGATKARRSLAPRFAVASGGIEIRF